jgi:hypothetical protein
MNRRFVPCLDTLPDISKECSKCPILIKEVAVIKDLQVKLFGKIEGLEKNVEIIMRHLISERSK